MQEIDALCSNFGPNVADVLIVVNQVPFFMEQDEFDTDFAQAFARFRSDYAHK